MSDAVINLLIQIPLVGIFILFILERDKRSDAKQLERDQQWREFLKEQREQNNAAVARLAEEIKKIAQQVSHLDDAITSPRKRNRNA